MGEGEANEEPVEGILARTGLEGAEDERFG